MWPNYFTELSNSQASTFYEICEYNNLSIYN
jgi:hypothetical protein